MSQLQARIRIVAPSIEKALRPTGGAWSPAAQDAAIGMALREALSSVLSRHRSVAVSQTLPTIHGDVDYFDRFHGTYEIVLTTALHRGALRIAAEVRARNARKMLARECAMADVARTVRELAREALHLMELREDVSAVETIRLSGGVVELAEYFAAIWGKPGVSPLRAAEAAGDAGFARGYIHLARWSNVERGFSGRRPDADEQSEIVARAYRLDPDDPEVLAAFVIAACDSGQSEHAARALAALAPQLPNSPELAMAAVRLARATADRDAAAAYANRAWELAPYSNEATTILLAEHRENGRDADALATLTSAHAHFPDDFRYQFLLADEHRRQKQYKQALAVFEALVTRAATAHWDDLWPLKQPHLSFVDSAIYVAAQPMAECTCLLGNDPLQHVRTFFALSPDPEAVASAYGGEQAYVAMLKSKKLGALREDPRMTEAAKAGPDGGIRDFDTYVRLALELRRAQDAGVSHAAALEFHKLDAAKWMNAQTFWSAKMEEPSLAVRFGELRRAFEASPPPMPAYPAAAPQPTVAAAPVANDPGKIATVEDWGRAMAIVQKTMGAGGDFPTALGKLGLSMPEYLQTSSYWNAKTTADPELGQRMFAAMTEAL